MQLTKSFSTDEMRCPCCGLCLMNPGFMASLQMFRDRWDKPLKINSGYRCEKHNYDVGGAKTSQHLRGRAADCEVNAADRYAFIKLAFEVGFAGIGVGSTYVHLDTRYEARSLWKYKD